MSVNYCALKCVYMLNICAIINPWAQDAFWTSYVRSIYVLCLRWSMYVKHVNPYNTRTHLSKIISWGCNWVNQFQIKWLHKILGVPGTLFYKTICKISRISRMSPTILLFLPPARILKKGWFLPNSTKLWNSSFYFFTSSSQYI